MWIIGGFSFSVTKSGSDESASAHLPFIVPPQLPILRLAHLDPTPKDQSRCLALWGEQ